MKKRIKGFFGKKFRTTHQILTSILCIALVVYFMPRDKVFNYQFDINTPWSYGQLMANFDFPIYKSNEQIKAQQDSIRRHFTPYFVKDTTVVDKSLAMLRNRFHGSIYTIPQENYTEYRRRLKEIYKHGIVSSEDLEIAKKNIDKNIKLIIGNISTTEPVKRLFKTTDAYIMLTKGDTLPREVINSLRLEEFIIPNIKYDSALSENSLQQELDALSTSDGIVQKGQKIISRGEIVDYKTYQILKSYNYELDKRTNSESKTTLILIGQIMFVTICFSLLLAYIYIYANEVANSTNRFLLVMLLCTTFPIIVGLMMQMRMGNVAMIPFAITPMLLSLFTSSRTAFVAHTICIITCSIMLNSPYEFVLMQIPAGFVAMLSLRELSSRSQMFRCVLFVFLTYALSYLCYEVIVENDIKKINFVMYIYFTINAILLLFAYPLMFIVEKLFGFVSNVTLIEISNINSELLRKLSQDAPGTFQHSMQVSNLAADAARNIGANSLEVRTGALFHDIGKTLNPIYFTENQSGGINPHNQLSPEESARIIIKHVTDGLALADKHHLPRSIKNFISTHHGKSKTGYFYITYKNNHPDEEFDESIFTYPGPKPSTKEQAVLMLADSVEAASHSISEYTAENIDGLVEKIVTAKLNEGELSESPITFQDIEIIKSTFKERLKSIYHTRISYPTEKKR
ncbi:MAG: HDIG domain-containing protein [Bacteroidaceae bacterium]|nr:HDIG domain-containing protein [Bacteroidaceae bacterium]